MPETPDHDVTRLLHEWAGGDERAKHRLMELVYPELRRIAASHFRGERSGHTLQPTALVHEAYLRLAHQSGRHWEDRTHFFAVAARIVRRILVDQARARRTVKRGDGASVLTLSDVASSARSSAVDLLDLDAALAELERRSSRQSQIVELRYFAGLSIEETAVALGVSPSSVKRDWLLAKTWLRTWMAGQAAPGRA